MIYKNSKLNSDDPTCYKIAKLASTSNSHKLEHTNYELYYQENSFNNLKKFKSNLLFLNNYNSVTLINYPHLDANKKISFFEFEFPIAEYLAISSCQIIACSKSGWLAIKQRDFFDDTKIETVSEFQIDIFENEIVSKMIYFDSEDILLIFVADKVKNTATKMLIYEVIASSDNVTLIQQNIKVFNEVEKIVDAISEVRVNFIKTILLLFSKHYIYFYSIEDRNWWVEKLRSPIKLYGEYVGSVIHNMNQLWVLDSNGNILLVNKNVMMNEDDEEEEEDDEVKYSEEDNSLEKDIEVTQKNEANDDDNDSEFQYDEDVKKIIDAHLHNTEREEFQKKLLLKKQAEEAMKDHDDIGEYIDSESDGVDEDEEEEEEEEDDDDNK